MVRGLYGWNGRTVLVVSVVGLLLSVAFGLPADAQTAESNTYQATDLEFGTTTGEGCSEAYCVQTNLGQVVIGDSANDVMNAQFSDDATDEPSLEVIVANSSSNMGVLKTTKVASKTMALRIKTNRTAGYSVQLVGNPPKAGTHTLKTATTPSTIKAGTEGFGVNVVANTDPEIGRNPSLVDTNQEQTSAVTDRYNQPNHFMYQPGDMVIKNLTGTGRVDYVVSMVVAISSDTPPGFYAGTLQAVITPLM